MPPNRPMGADIPELSDAAQEFLADWLVRHKYDEAMEFISDESLTCLVDEPGIDLEKGDAAGHAGSPRSNRASVWVNIPHSVQSSQPQVHGDRTFASWIIGLHGSLTWSR